MIVRTLDDIVDGKEKKLILNYIETDRKLLWSTSKNKIIDIDEQGRLFSEYNPYLKINFDKITGKKEGEFSVRELSGLFNIYYNVLKNGVKRKLGKRNAHHRLNHDQTVNVLFDWMPVIEDWKKVRDLSESLGIPNRTMYFYLNDLNIDSKITNNRLYISPVGEKQLRKKIFNDENNEGKVNDWLITKDISRMIGVGAQKVCTYLKKYDIKSSMIKTGSVWRISPSEVIKLASLKKSFIPYVEHSKEKYYSLVRIARQHIKLRGHEEDRLKRVIEKLSLFIKYNSIPHKEFRGRKYFSPETKKMLRSLMTLAEIGKIIGNTKSEVVRKIDEGIIKRLDIGNNYYYSTVRDIRNYLGDPQLSG